MTLRELIAALKSPDLAEDYDSPLRLLDRPVRFHTSSADDLHLLSVYMSEDSNHIEIDIGDNDE